ncbi:hypothetical protein D3C80_1744290 [compost metagenome]
MVFREPALVGEQELLEFILQQLILALEIGDQAENFLQDFLETQAAIHCGCTTQFVEVEIFVGLVEQIGNHVVDGLFPLLVFDLLLQGRVGLDLILEFLEEHAVNFHSLVAN